MGVPRRISLKCVAASWKKVKCMPKLFDRKLPVLQIVLTLCGVILLAFLFRNVSVEILSRSFDKPLLLGVALLVPYSITFFLDAAAWTRLFRHGLPVKVRKLAFIRLVSEPFTLTLPGGAVIGESLKAVLAGKTYGISLADSGVSVLLYRFGLGASQIVFVTIGAFLAYPELQRQSVRIIGMDGLGNLALSAAALFAAILIGLFLFVSWFQPAKRLLAIESVSRGSSWKKKWVQIVQGIHKLETTIFTQVKEQIRSVLSALILFFLGWIIGVVETFLMARSIGIPLTIGQAFIVESMGSIFRIVGIFLPSGVGAQDWAYTTILSLYTVQDPLALGASFAVLKRIRETAWIGAGFLTLSVTIGGKTARAMLAQATNR